MKINYKEYVVIGNACEEKQVIVLSDIQFYGGKEIYDSITKSFEEEVNSFLMNKLYFNDFQKMLRENPEDALKHIENQKCVVTEFYDLDEEVWKRTVKMVKIVEK